MEGKKIKIRFSKKADRNLRFWQKSGDKIILEKINSLMEVICKNPSQGIESSKGLKYHHKGRYSRCIDPSNSIIYEVEGKNIVYIFQLKGNYDKEK